MSSSDSWWLSGRILNILSGHSQNNDILSKRITLFSELYVYLIFSWSTFTKLNMLISWWLINKSNKHLRNLLTSIPTRRDYSHIIGRHEASEVNSPLQLSSRVSVLCLSVSVCVCVSVTVCGTVWLSMCLPTSVSVCVCSLGAVLWWYTVRCFKASAKLWSNLSHSFNGIWQTQNTDSCVIVFSFMASLSKT